MEEKKRFPGLILCMCGFLLGSFIPNLIWKTEWHQGTLEAIYYLTSFTASGSVSGIEYLKEIIKFRGSLWSLCMICGFSVFGAPLAVTGLLILGCRIGMVIAVSILEFGLLGGLYRSRAFVPTISFIYSGMDFFDGTDMGTVHGHLETQRIISCEQKTLFGKNRHICTASVRRNSGRMLSESLDRRKNSGLSEIITGIRQYSSDIKKLQYFVRVVIKYTICGRIPRKALILLDFGIKKV